MASPLLVAIAALALAGPAPSVDAEGQPCARPDALVQLGFLDLAEVGYLAQDDPASRSCVAHGLQTVERRRELAAARAALGDRLAETRPDSAMAAYRTALSLDSSSQEAREGLEALLSPEAEKEAEAEDKAAFAGAKDKGDDWFTALTNLGAFLLAVLAWAALVLGALLVALNVLRPLLGRRVRSEWEGGSRRSWLLRIAYWFYGRDVRVSDVEAPEGIDGKALGAVMGAALTEGATWRRGTVDRITTPSADPTLLDSFGKAIAEVPKGKLVGAFLPLLSLLRARPVVELRGHVTSAEAKDAALILTLTRRSGTIVNSVSLRAGDYGPQEHVFTRMAIAGAAWARHALLADPKHGPAVLGTDDARSAARFAAGTTLRKKDEGFAARDLYARALEFDPGNAAARYNLAFLDIAENRFEVAERELETTIQTLAGVDPDPTLDQHPAWFAATYNLAAVRLYRGAAEKHRRNAWLTARELALELIRVRARVDDPGLSTRADLLAFLDEIEAVALVLLASARLELSREPGDAPTGPAPARSWRCEFKKRLEKMELRDPTPEAGSPFERMPSGLPTLEARELALYYVGRGLAPHRPRTRYNLACFLSRVGDIRDAGAQAGVWEQALDHLQAAAAIASIAEWAKRDPALHALREAQPEKFEEVIGEKAEKPTKALAELAAIGEAAADALHKAGVLGFDDLVERAARPGDRRALAGRVKHPPSELRAWAELAELVVAAELEVEEVNLLDQAELGSIRVLRETSAGMLRTILTEVARAQDPAAKVPSRARIDEIAAAAASTDTRIE